MNIDQRDHDVVLAGPRDAAETVERRDPLAAVAIDEQTIPDGGADRQLTTAEVIRAMTATFRRRRS